MLLEYLLTLTDVVDRIYFHQSLIYTLIGEIHIGEIPATQCSQI
jgi:hypothetical protein